jgi:hypothetical protein
MCTARGRRRNGEGRRGDGIGREIKQEYEEENKKNKIGKGEK